MQNIVMRFFSNIISRVIKIITLSFFLISENKRFNENPATLFLFALLYFGFLTEITNTSFYQSC